MRFPSPEDWARWGLTDRRRRYFVERWRELLDSASPVSHRAPVTGALELLRELNRVQKQLRGQSYGKSGLKALEQEAFGTEVPSYGRVDGSLATDPLAPGLVGSLLRHRAASTRHFLTGGAPPAITEFRDTASTTLLLHHLQSRYLKALIDELEEVLYTEPAPPDAIARIDGLETALVSELLAMGYADSFLRTHERILTSSRTGPNERARFQSFRSRLETLPTPVTVVFRVQGSNDIWSNWPAGASHPERSVHAPPEARLPDEWEAFAKEANPVRFITVTVSAYDHHAASRRAFQLLQNAADLTFVRAPSRELHVVSAATIRGEGRSIIAIADSTQMQLHRVPVPQSARTDDSKSIQFTSALAPGPASDSARRRLSGALRYYRISISQSWLESSLTNLWTALEVLASVDYEEPVIERVVRSLVPLLASGKVRDLTNDLLGYMLSAKLNEHEAFRTDFGDVFDKDLISPLGLMRVIADPNRAKQMSDLAEQLSPLLAYRISEYHSYVKDGKILASRVVRTARRVEWQLRRLYRLRNDIVHGAGVANNAERLLEHLQMYVYHVILVEGRLLAADNGLSNIEEVVSAVDLAFHSWIERIRQVRDIAKAPADVVADLHAPPYEQLVG